MFKKQSLGLLKNFLYAPNEKTHPQLPEKILNFPNEKLFWVCLKEQTSWLAQSFLYLRKKVKKLF